MSALLDRIRPHPHRGAVIAAGAVPLALAAVLIELRMTQWALGFRFAIVALLAALLLTMGVLAPLEGDSPRPYHSVLLLSGLLPLIVALQLLAEILGSSRPPGAGGEFWTFGAIAALAAWLARRFRSAVCTLIAALAAAVAVEAFVIWAFRPQGPGTVRAFLVVLGLVFVAGAVRLRDGNRRHAVQLVNAAGLVTVALVLTLVPGLVFAAAVRSSGLFTSAAIGVSFGWKLYLLAIGFGLVAYAAVDREPGPAYIGVAVLAAFVLMAAPHPLGRGSLVGWPLFLLVIGAIGLAIGLRPRRPLPPPPGSSQPAPTVPLHPQASSETMPSEDA